MDIDLLSKMVKELILDNERVVLPGLGSFVAEVVPATFSDKGYTINPPYRKLYFRSKPDQGSDLIPFYAKSNSVSEDIAEKVIVEFISELKSILFHKKTIIFPGLGRLRATKENNVFFVADEDLDIYPEGFGLEPISLKTHQETQAEVKAAVSDLKSILTDSDPVVEIEIVPEPEYISEPEPIVAPVVSEPVVAPIVSEPVVAPVVSEHVVAPVVNHPEMRPVVVVPQMAVPKVEAPVVQEPVATKSVLYKVLLIIMWVVVAVVALALVYALVSRICPEWVDQFLYTEEELELLKNRL